MLQRVNSSVNDAIWPEEDERHYGRAEFWTIPTDGYGDCEDYALTKRKALIDAGLSASALRIAVVVTPHDARHAVLTVATDRGDFVLDNLRNDVVAWNATGFAWVERQDPNRAMGWVSLEEPAVLMAANGINIPVAAVPTAKIAVASVESAGNSTAN
jgi:predicted transglutaminase-like cysteine proteinase